MIHRKIHFLYFENFSPKTMRYGVVEKHNNAELLLHIWTGDGINVIKKLKQKFLKILLFYFSINVLSFRVKQVQDRKRTRGLTVSMVPTLRHEPSHLAWQTCFLGVERQQDFAQYCHGSRPQVTLTIVRNSVFGCLPFIHCFLPAKSMVRIIHNVSWFNLPKIADQIGEFQPIVLSQ